MTVQHMHEKVHVNMMFWLVAVACIYTEIHFSIVSNVNKPYPLVVVVYMYNGWPDVIYSTTVYW